MITIQDDSSFFYFFVTNWTLYLGFGLYFGGWGYDVAKAQRRVVTFIKCFSHIWGSIGAFWEIRNVVALIVG